MISFSLTSADFLRLQKIVTQRIQRRIGLFSTHFGLRVLTWLCIGLAGATYARLFQDWPEISNPLMVIGIASVLALLIAIAQPQLSQALLQKHLLMPGGAFLSPQNISFSSASIRVESQRGRTETPWSAFLDRDEDDLNYYLFIDATQAVVIPRSALGSHLAEFEQLTRNISRKGQTSS